MVNLGKPSRGCASCRKRKIKCDQTEPACLHCVKSGWVCPGYKADTDLYFRDQTELVRRRAHARQRGITQRQSIDHTHKILPQQQNQQANHQSGRTLTVSPPILDRATAFFFHQYVFRENQNSELPTRGHHEYLPALLLESSSSGALATITAASGLASLANAGSSPSWKAEAYKLYGNAIRQLQVALKDPIELKSDQTLATIMLMGTFEAITCENRGSMKSFSNHTIAAARLIDLRGPDQFRSDLAMRIFLQIRRLIVLTSHQLMEPMPYTLEKWSAWAEPTQRNDETHANRFSEINGRLAAARYFIKSKRICTPSIVASLLLPIDALLKAWQENLPPSWLPESYRSLEQSKSDVGEFAAQYDVYPDLWVASMWNNYRSARILIHETLMNWTLKYGSIKEKLNLQPSVELLQSMTAGICHSVLYFLGYCRKDFDVKNPERVEIEAGIAIPGGYLLMWPLYMAGMLPTTSKNQRQWIASRLHQVGGNMGLQLATSLAKALEEDDKSLSDTELWYIGGPVSKDVPIRNMKAFDFGGDSV